MLKAPEHQVAGHFTAAGQLGPLVDGHGFFFKPLQSTDRGSNEVNFYTSFSSDPRVPSSLRLRFFPSFHGTQILSLPSTDCGTHHHPHLVLEDLTAGLSNPSIIDLKIGSRTWAPSHSQSYFEKCLKKDRETTSLALGFRFSGLQISRQDGGRWKPTREEIKKYTTADDVRSVLRRFVSESGDGDLDCSLASEVYGGSDGVLAQLLELKSWFEDQTIYHFYSASVMVMFEKGKGKPRVKLVDFAHVVEGDGVIDHNFLGGLCSLIKFISEVLTDPDEGAKKKEGKLENGESGFLIGY